MFIHVPPEIDWGIPLVYTTLKSFPLRLFLLGNSPA